MPSITVYLKNKQFDFVRNDPSKLIQKALEEFMNNENKSSE